MAELENSAVTEQIVTEEKPAEEKEVLTKDSVLEMLKAREEEINKKWQSRFDKLVTEKNTVDTKAMTVEQRLAQIEAERQAERLSFTRERARNKAQIDENFERAIKLYGSDKEEEIAAGAEAISNFIQEMKKSFEAEKAKAVQEALFKAGIQKTPTSGDSTPTDLKAQYEKALKDGNGDLALALQEKMQRS